MFILNNNEISLKIKKEGYISSLKYQSKEYIGGKIPLFEIKYLNRNGDELRVNSFDCTLLSAERSENSLSIIYKKEETEIKVSVKLDKNLKFTIKLSSWEGLAPEWINYPGICVRDDLADKGGESKILWGFNEGALIEDMTVRDTSWFPYKEPYYPSIGLYGLFPAAIETQFMAYYDNVSGMYFGSHDNKNHLKGIDFYRREGGICLQFLHYTGANFGEGFELPYDQVIEFFRGEWQDACEIYRAWFDENHADDMVKISENKSLPDWYRKSPIIITYPVRGKFDTDVMTPNKLFPYINVMPHVERFEELFGSKIMIILMHWEGTAPWAPPIVWPPYGGEEKLGELIDALHERGDTLGVYCSGLGWTIKSNLDDYDTTEIFEKQDLKREMCLSPKGDLPYSKICTAQRSGYDMCPTRNFTRNTVKREITQMAGAGIDYIQLMDQNHGGTSYFCYSRDHGHPPVPGKWQVDAVKSLLTYAKEGEDKLLLGCESAAAESYIPQLGFSDNRFELTYALGRPVPAYSYIYHEYVNNFMGNQVCADAFINPDKNPESYYERIAYAFCAGDMLTVIINDDGNIERSWGKNRNIAFMPDEALTAALIKNLNAWRQKYPQYLNTGRMEKPLKTECAIHSMKRAAGSILDVRTVHTSAFSSEVGSFAQFFVNWTESPQEVTIISDTRGYMLKDIDGNVISTNACGRFFIPQMCALMMEKQP